MNIILKQIDILELWNHVSKTVDFDNNQYWQFRKGNIIYYKNYYGNIFVDKSFGIFDNNKLISYAYITVSNEITYFKMPIKININHEYQSKKLLKLIVNHLKDLSRISKDILLYCHPHLDYELQSNTNWSYEAIHQKTYRLLISKEHDTFKSNLRKSYRSLVNWSERKITTNTIDSSNFDELEISKFKKFHFSVAGKKTRSNSTWESQSMMIKSGEAVLFNGYIENQLVSSAYFILGTKTAYYGVGVYDRDLMKTKGVAHGCIHSAYKYLRDMGVTFLDLGVWRTDEVLTDKEINILNFKRGFTNYIATNNVIKIKL